MKAIIIAVSVQVFSFLQKKIVLSFFTLRFVAYELLLNLLFCRDLPQETRIIASIAQYEEVWRPYDMRADVIFDISESFKTLLNQLVLPSL